MAELADYLEKKHGRLAHGWRVYEDAIEGLISFCKEDYNWNFSCHGFSSKDQNFCKSVNTIMHKYTYEDLDRGMSMMEELIRIGFLGANRYFW